MHYRARVFINYLEIAAGINAAKFAEQPDIRKFSHLGSYPSEHEDRLRLAVIEGRIGYEGKELAVLLVAPDPSVTEIGYIVRRSERFAKVDGLGVGACLILLKIDEIQLQGEYVLIIGIHEHCGVPVYYACVVGHIALVDRICDAAVRQFYSAKIAVAALGVNVEIIEPARFIDTLVKVKLAAQREFC